MADATGLGKRIAHSRKHLGLSQAELAHLVGRSESWMSQVERGVRPIDRLSVLQKVADALSMSVAELRGSEDEEDESPPAVERPEAFEELRLVLTGHPAIGVVLIRPEDTITEEDLERLRNQHAPVWDFVHGTRYGELAPILGDLIPELERAVRLTASDDVRRDVRLLLVDTYQATAALLAKLSENDAAWIAADRACLVAELLDSPLHVAASMFRMAHVFLSLQQLAQAHAAAQSASRALDPHVDADPQPEGLSLLGAFQLVLAVAAARNNERSQAHSHLEHARQMADQLGEDRNDFGTEFGPTNVDIHAVSIAVELGDAGMALDLANKIDPAQLSPERQARFLIDIARAQAMRRQIGEAMQSLRHAEDLAPEHTRSLKTAREVARDLLQLAGARTRPELRELADRFGVLS